jgi:hypothetical protein
VKAWLQTYKNGVFDFFEPSPESIDLEDIAHALSLQNRFNGHTAVPYSVAEHSVRVYAEVRRRAGPDDKTLLLWALLHDAAEAYVGDLIQPIKRGLRAKGFGAFDDLEGRAMRAVCQKFGLPPRQPELVTRVDVALCATEARDLVWRGRTPPRAWHLTEPPLELPIEPWHWKDAKARFFAAVAEVGGL